MKRAEFKYSIKFSLMSIVTSYGQHIFPNVLLAELNVKWLTLTSGNLKQAKICVFTNFCQVASMETVTLQSESEPL